MDNITANPGAGGAVLATDEIATVHYPRSKVVFGVDGVATDVSASDPLPITASSLPLPSGAATQATLASILAAFKAEDSASASSDLGLPLLCMRQLADTTSTDNDGDYSLIKIDEEGRVKVATKPASFAIVSGNITASAQTVFADVSRASNIMIMMTASSLVGHNSTFEGSIDSTNGTDGTWFGIQVVRSNANTIELTTGVLAATPAYAWEASVNGLSFVRVRATAHTSGTATWKFQRGSYATEPVPAAQISGTQPVSGTVTATVTGGTVLPVTPTTTFTNSAATTNATSIKASAGTVWSINATNTNAAVRYLKLYNKASAPTVGTDVPVLTIPLAIGVPTVVHGGSNGMRFATGIAFAITTGATDADTGAVAANEIKVATTFT